MSVWDSIVGQQRVVEQLREISCGDGSDLAQSWLICGPPGSGRSQVAKAFAAALESPDHGEGDELSDVARQVMAGSHPDVMTLTTSTTTIGIDAVRDLIVSAEQMPATAPWRIIIIEDVDRMLERTTNVLLKEIEEPSAHTIWLLCAPSAQDVLPTIRSRTRIVNLGVPEDAQVAAFLESRGVEPALAARAARLAEGHIGIALLYADDNGDILADRDEIVVRVIELARASQAVLLADFVLESAKRQAHEYVAQQVEAAQAEFRRINGLAEGDRMAPALRVAYHALSKKEDVRKQETRSMRDVLDRALNTVASVYRDVAVLQNDATDQVGMVNLENRKTIADLSARISREHVIHALDQIEVARKRIMGNGNPLLDFEALFCALIAPR